MVKLDHIIRFYFIVTNILIPNKPICDNIFIIRVKCTTIEN